MERSRKISRSKPRRETRAVMEFPSSENIAQRRARNLAIAKIPIPRSPEAIINASRCWRANPNNLRGIYEPCKEDSPGNNREPLHYCSKSNCRNRMCRNNNLCCMKDPRQDEESEDSCPFTGVFLCIPCFWLEMANLDIEKFI